MRMYLSQSTCVEVDLSEIKLSSIPFYFNTCGLRWIHMHPNKALIGTQSIVAFFLGRRLYIRVANQIDVSDNPQTCHTVTD